MNKGRHIDIPEILDEDEIVDHEIAQEMLPLENENSFEEVVKGYHNLTPLLIDALSTL